MPQRLISFLPDLIFAFAFCIFAVALLQSDELATICPGGYRFRALPVFDVIPVQVWMLLGLLTALVVPVIAAWAFRAHGRIAFAAIGQAVLFLLQVGMEAMFAANGEIDKIVFIGAIFSSWRAVRLGQLAFKAGRMSRAWGAILFICALQWAINLSFLAVVISRNCLA
jgi:hypothetical protein